MGPIKKDTGHETMSTFSLWESCVHDPIDTLVAEGLLMNPRYRKSKNMGVVSCVMTSIFLRFSTSS